MQVLYFILFLAAGILFLISSVRVAAGKVNLQALGLLFFVLPFMIMAARQM